MKILCVGYPRTGTRSLWEALTILGFNALHHDEERIPLLPPMGYDFRVYDDVDAATEEIYWREVAEAYPEAKMIITLRGEESWWRSVQYVVNENRSRPDKGEVARFDQIQSLLYGCAYPSEYLYKKRYAEHFDAVLNYATDRCRDLLIFPLCQFPKWDLLCDYLDVPVPDVPFPWNNRCMTEESAGGRGWMDFSSAS
jgi:hypothetical protein